MSKIGTLLYGDRQDVSMLLDAEDMDNNELRAAIQRCLTLIGTLESRIAELENKECHCHLPRKATGRAGKMICDNCGLVAKWA